MGGGAQVRCLIISLALKCMPPGGNAKSLVLFGLADGAGTLAEALAIFNRHRVNLTYIQSHADLTTPSQFNFFCELEGEHRLPTIAGALVELRRCCQFVKILGCYSPGDAFNRARTKVCHPDF